MTSTKCTHCQGTGFRTMTRAERYRRGRLPLPPPRCPYCADHGSEAPTPGDVVRSLSARRDGDVTTFGQYLPDDEPEGPKAA